MINRRTRSHLFCQGSHAAVGDIAELPGISMPSVRLNLDDLAGLGELGVTVNPATLDKSKSIDDR